jgi:hypothetical protein
MEAYAGRLLVICSELERVSCGPDLLHTLDPQTSLVSDLIHYSARANREVARLLFTYLRQQDE